jgi:hypothetical protein
MPWLFHIFLAIHVGGGIVALTSFWGAVASKKGGTAHRRWGYIFATAIYIVCAQALGMGILSVFWPLAMHKGLTDATLYRGLLGWMMIYLAILTVTMTRYGLQMISNRRDHSRNRRWPIMGLLSLTGGTGLNCLVHGAVLGHPLMILVGVLGFGVVITYWQYLVAKPPGQQAYVREHLKAMIATGISAYTAFLSVGLIELVPEHAFNPIMWVLPSVVGTGLLVHFLRRYPKAPHAAGATRTS